MLRKNKIKLKYLLEFSVNENFFDASLRISAIMSKLGYLLLSSSLVVFALISLTAANGGHLGHGEQCDPSPSQMDEHKKCDTFKRLSCSAITLTCQCHHEDRDIFDENSKSCETKAGKGCGVDTTFPTVCVDNAVCNETSHFCECQDGYQQHEGQCSGQKDSANIFICSMAMFLLLSSVFICT